MDKNEIRELMRFFDKSEITKLKIKEGDFTIELQKGFEGGVTYATAPTVSAPVVVAAQASSAPVAIDVAVFGLAMKSNAPAMTEPFTAAEEAAAKLQDKIIDLSSDLKTLIEGVIVDVSVALGTQLGNALSGAKFQISALLVPIADAIVSFGKMAIQAGVTALAIKAALKLGNPLLAIASGIALVAIGTAIKNGIGAPKLAEGGLAFGPTLATVGDNRGARVDPEVIAPLSKLKSMMGDMGIGGTLETRISGNDLIILLNRSQKGLNRVQ